MKTDIPFDPEGTVLQLQVLHGLVDDIIARAEVESWGRTCDQIGALLDAMEPLTNALYQYLADGGVKE